MPLYKYLTIILYISILSLISCAVPIQEANNNYETPTAMSSSVDKPIANKTSLPEMTTDPSAEDKPIMTATPSPPAVIPEATAAPPTGYFVKITPTTVCVGDTLTFSAYLQRSGVKSLFLEKDLNREGKVPYFAGPYVLIQRFESEKDAHINHAFTLTDPMKDADGEKTLAMQPGKYLMHLMYENTEITGVDYITVTECNR